MMYPAHARTLLATAALLLCSLPSDATEPPSMVEWTDAPLPTNSPQTPQQEELGKTQGRALPRPELLQPTLDPDLPVERPCQSVHLQGNFKGASSDVLPGLVKL